MATYTGRLLALLTIILLLVGCGRSAASEDHTGPRTDDVALSITGGIAGVQHGIEVRPDGSVRLTDRKGSREARGLSSAERKKLDSLLAAVDFTELPARSISADSRDRFEYRLTYDDHSLVTDGSTDLGPADDLIRYLETCMRTRR
ncbi:protealysin inhibitor emfourin [Streptomyces niger]|uniref:protealysin inhibitor emfourin n=1 Tax=Streptomyces niger TaxID=66373 RepID=UPI00069A53B2|nr:hypothetical protein [Streptomyces niger]